jgi:peptide/nickel transport system ATP-binding protein
VSDPRSAERADAAGADSEGDAAGNGPLVRVEGLTKYFTQGGGFLSSLFGTETVKAVEQVTFDIERGETLGLVGESGCGKSTLARTVLRLLDPTDGSVRFNGADLASLSGERLRRQRQDMQMIFQDPQSSLDPRMKVGPIVEEPMRAHGLYAGEREERARMLLNAVGLDPQHYNRYPHQFSGGQRQRVNLARALSVNPEFIVCDEPTSALDASIQAQVLNTMRELQREFGLTYLFISHDLSVIRHISDRVAVMYLGQLVELADTDELFENPQHPYTEALLQSIPVPDPRVEGSRGVLEGDVPSPIDPPSGCRFRTRCPKLIAPDDLRLTDAEWDDVRAFTRAVSRRTVAGRVDGEGRGALRSAFFPDGTPSGEAGDAVETAIDALLAGDHERADAVLTETFAERSICARELPAYDVDSELGESRHFAACHLHR